MQRGGGGWGGEQVNAITLFNSLKSRHGAGNLETDLRSTERYHRAEMLLSLSDSKCSFYKIVWDFPLQHKFNCKGEIKGKEYVLKIMCILKSKFLGRTNL